MKIALAMICKGSDSEARYLDRALKNISPYVDGIFVTQTQPNSAVEKVCRRYKVVRSEFSWNGDFAAARNFNFSQVPKEYDYILWMDADDMWRGMEKLKPTLKKNLGVDAFGFWYLYDWDEDKKPIVVHKKTMLIKNDGCAIWKGALHEELDPTRELSTLLMNGIDRLHLSDDEMRRKENAQRNVEISKAEAKKLPNDPRTYWNLGNSYYGVGDHKGAITAYNHFLMESNSEDEKYIAHCRIADVYKTCGMQEEALRELHIAIGLLPNVPEAYLQMGYLYYGFNNMDKAEEYILMGILKKPLIHKMIVFNPRDYDYNPMMLLAQVYYQKNRPDLMLPMLKGCLRIYPKDEKLKKLVKEGSADKKKLEKALYAVRDLQKIRSKSKLLAALNKLPLELRTHPAVSVIRNQNFTKTETSGKDLVYYCGQTVHEWYPGSGFIGGSEEAVINLCREFAKAGWNVTVYNNCGIKERTFDGVTYKPFWMFNHRDKQDVMILWRWPRPLDYDMNVSKIFIDLHDVIPMGEFNEKRLIKINRIFVKSKFHRDLFPNVPDNKFAIVPNGVDLSLFDEVKKDPMLVINTSSPDRSMDVLPKLWMEVKKQVPKAKLQWCYGWDLFKKHTADDPKKMKWMRDTQKAMKDAGIEDIGRKTQEEVAKVYSKASFFAYPTEFAEIDCISARKAQIAGCYPVTTDFGALKETVRYGVTIHSDKTGTSWNRPYQFTYGLESESKQKKWVDAMVHALKNGPIIPKNNAQWAQYFSWENTAKLWIEYL